MLSSHIYSIAAKYSSNIITKFKNKIYAIYKPAIDVYFLFLIIYRNTDYDSWGEESDDEPDVDPGHYMPYPHAYAAPPQVVFGAPFPVYYPQPPPVKSQKRRRIKTENDYSQPQYSPRVDPTRQPLVERYQDVNRSVPSKSKRKQSQRVHFSHPMAPMNGYMGYPGFPTYVYPQYYGGAGYYGREEGKYKVCDLIVYVNCITRHN